MIRKKTVSLGALIALLALMAGITLVADASTARPKPRQKQHIVLPRKHASATASTTARVMEARKLEERRSTSTEASTSPVRKLELLKMFRSRFGTSTASSVIWTKPSDRSEHAATSTATSTKGRLPKHPLPLFIQHRATSTKTR